MAEYKHFDGEDFVTFDILSVNAEKKEVEVAITNRGKITVTSFEILTDNAGELYFEYSCMSDRIYLHDFEEEAR